ncbi:MAG: response regulator [Deltaproteobacteria bacterium]|mgnify:CR=1 FL=1|nr:response regulator [Deltaproteobacteria bacterium]MBW2013523.1 response regulator [Deltaproteobacteria bacterium]MBW2089969.1 response regulator [Deltaproteobacteria bacterium]MBW2319964.1 response regulator [Deltaproteobacteria bacterium]
MKRQTILVVDDERLVLKSIKRVLRNENYNILTAESGDQGLLLLKDYDVQLVISDYNMPGMNGLEFLQNVKRDHHQILTIMLTGQMEIEIAMKAINEAGVYKFILKPWEDADLIITIRRALESLELILERESLLQQIKTRDVILQDLEKEHPGITKVERDENGYIIVDC